MMRLFLFLLSLGTVVLSQPTDLCSNEVIIEKINVNNEYSFSVFDFKVNINLRITQNLFNAKGKLVKSLSNDFNDTVMIDKTDLTDLVWKPFTSIDKCEILISSPTFKASNIKKWAATYTTLTGVPIVRQFKLDSKVKSARFLEKGHDCQLLEKRFAFLEGRVVSPLLPFSRSVTLVLSDLFDWNLLPAEEKARGYSTTEINELGMQYNFGRFALIK